MTITRFVRLYADFEVEVIDATAVEASATEIWLADFGEVPNGEETNEEVEIVVGQIIKEAFASEAARKGLGRALGLVSLRPVSASGDFYPSICLPDFPVRTEGGWHSMDDHV